MGFQDAGFNIVGAFEFWDIAADCYEKILNTLFIVWIYLMLKSPLKKSGC